MKKNTQNYNNNKKNNNKKKNGRVNINAPTRAKQIVPYKNETLGISYNIGIPKLVDPKFVVASLNMSVVGVWTVVSLTSIAQGVTENQRIGMWVKLRYIEFIFSMNSQNADIYTNSRICVVQWHPQSANQPFTTASVFQTNNYLYSGYNIDGAQAYTFLYDSKYAQSGTASNPTPAGNITEHFVLKNRFRKNLLFAAGTTTSFDSIYFIALSDSLVAPFPTINGASTTYFYS